MKIDKDQLIVAVFKRKTRDMFPNDEEIERDRPIYGPTLTADDRRVMNGIDTILVVLKKAIHGLPMIRAVVATGDSDNSDDDHSGPSDDSSSGEDDDVWVSRVPRSRIKLHKFDGSESWESWWAHFQNCASYNRWSERDKLAFMKGALTGNAAQVLWYTDRFATGSFRKLVDALRSRYSGERQAEKYRAELQIRRRKCAESLSDLHQDIRRLIALAYPKLTADAREEIACDHFTNAVNDAEYALKVKERAPMSLDEALELRFV